MIDLDDVLRAKDRIAPWVPRTPTFSASTIGERMGIRLYLKAELFQKTGSFKVRGVFNKLLSLTEDELGRGLVSISAGNHAAALAFAATALGADATIVMPTGAVASKVEATRRYGGRPVLTDDPLMDVCMEIQERTGAVLIHPFDDPLVIAGQGTVGLEILEDVPDVEAVVVPVGGGGLISGVAAAVKRLHPNILVYGVEPVTADAVTRALAAGWPVDIGHPVSIADGLTAPFAGRHTLELVQALVDRVVLVDDDQIVAALRRLILQAKLAAEPAGAAALAGVLTRAVEAAKGSKVVCVVSGGNADPAVLARVLGST